jgi:hypothetical protein
MNTHMASSSAVIAAGISMTILTAASSFGQNVEVADSNIVLGKVDGPYTYKSPTDLVAIIGFVTEVKGADDAVFRDCNGNTRNVKRHDLKRIQRNCPSGSPATPWIIDAKTGKLVPAPGYSLGKAYGYSGKGIDPGAFPADYRQELNGAKRGEPAAISWVSARQGKVDLRIIRKPEQQ